MKKDTTSILHFSGYPLKTADLYREEKPPSIVQKDETHHRYLVHIPEQAFDVPANWDESWFGNYE